LLWGNVYFWFYIELQEFQDQYKNFSHSNMITFYHGILATAKNFFLFLPHNCTETSAAIISKQWLKANTTRQYEGKDSIMPSHATISAVTRMHIGGFSTKLLQCTITEPMPSSYRPKLSCSILMFLSCREHIKCSHHSLTSTNIPLLSVTMPILVEAWRYVSFNCKWTAWYLGLNFLIFYSTGRKCSGNRRADAG
jgi:hypothetical protein